LKNWAIDRYQATRTRLGVQRLLKG